MGEFHRLLVAESGPPAEVASCGGATLEEEANLDILGRQ